MFMIIYEMFYRPIPSPSPKLGRGQIAEVQKELFQKSKSEIGLQEEKSPVLGDLGCY
jgi:hypothetical protein